MLGAGDLLAGLPIAAYTTDADGRLTFYNDAAAQLWGQHPELGRQKWCGSWRLSWPDGRAMPHEQCAMALALREARKISGQEALVERPDGTRVPFLAYPSPVRSSSGQVTGGICLLIDLSEQERAETETARLAAIVSSSEEAIFSKTLEGRITSWNAGAERIFGYKPEEIVGEPVARIIPPELLQQEEEFIAKLKLGERIDHFDSIRVGKDGRRVNVSMSISPIREKSGKIVGAASIVRDITERKESEKLQQLLFDELNHRVKNMLCTIQAMARQGLRTAKSSDEFVNSFTGRLDALAQAHRLVVENKWKGSYLQEIVRQQISLGGSDDGRVDYAGPQLLLNPRTTMHLSMVLHELAANARAYGALAFDSGKLTICWDVSTSSELTLNWKERGIPNLSGPRSPGLGSALIEHSLKSDGGVVSHRYCADGLECEIRLPLSSVD